MWSSSVTTLYIHCCCLIHGQFVGLQCEGSLLFCGIAVDCQGLSLSLVFISLVASYRDFIGAVVVLSVSCIYNVSMALLRERLACFKSCLSFVTQNSTCNAITNQAPKVGSKFTTLCFAAQICNVLINCFFSGLLVCRHVYPT